MTMQPLDSALVEALQAQYTRERQNEIAYLVIHHVFVMAGLEGFAKWAEGQANDERSHAAKIADYLSDKRNVLAQVRALSAEAISFDTPFQAFTAAAGLEAKNTDLILNLHALAEDVEDEDACIFLQWFIEEQRKSESEFKNWCAQLKLIENDGAGILAFDAALKGMD
jgi:ferritin